MAIFARGGAITITMLKLAMPLELLLLLLSVTPSLCAVAYLPRDYISPPTITSIPADQRSATPSLGQTLSSITDKLTPCGKECFASLPGFTAAFTDDEAKYFCLKLQDLKYAGRIVKSCCYDCPVDSPDFGLANSILDWCAMTVRLAEAPSVSTLGAVPTLSPSPDAEPPTGIASGISSSSGSSRMTGVSSKQPMPTQVTLPWDVEKKESTTPPQAVSASNDEGGFRMGVLSVNNSIAVLVSLIGVTGTIIAAGITYASQKR
ncbi:hypothetical protein HDU96_001498 [Phlyctochytrium bullatum]|nr:hypothetical protein HDU96_001498 [Phlyctochytrium bullatum]